MSFITMDCKVWSKLAEAAEAGVLAEEEQFVGNGASGAAAGQGWKPREASSPWN